MNEVELKARRLDTFIDDLSDPFFILDDHGIFTYLNKETEHLFLKSKQILEGKVIWDEVETLKNTLLYNQFKEVVNTDRSASFELLLNKSWYDVKIYCSNNHYAIQLHNITSRKKAIEETKQNYKSLFEYHPDAVYLLDLKGNFITTNKSFETIFEFSIDEALQMNFDLIVHPNDLRRTIYHFENAKTGISQNYEVTGITKYGKNIRVNITNIPVIVKDNVTAVFAIAKDISDQVEAQKLHIKTEKLSLIGDLAAGIAHEINNPLTTIKGFLQLWKEGALNHTDHYSIIESEIDRITLISNELLTLGKPISQEVKVHDIATFLHSISTLLQKEATKKNIRISCNIKEKTCWVSCNEAQIKQVFFNLIENAIDAMDNGGKMNVNALATNEHVWVEIIDEGKGIPPELLNKIGEPFYTTKEKGTGLGLMVCYGIVEQYKGEIFVNSKLDHGTTFSIKLPLAKA
ncbi:ATP-binding protein [Alkalihalobacillus sp. BA299]|uniref:ATP-binding protein n=1 Tax=Alkalihalobacillus sp. BA299 TaxID=2815938 RepID=UPI001ADBE96B|nr:ATP-binding protein [Alkalihalobacillus sp. BA299]